MTSQTSKSEQNRVRMALVLLLAGVVLVLFSWGSWTYRTSVAHVEPATMKGEPLENDSGQAQAIRALPLFLMVALLLVLVFLVGSYLLVRIGRRRRQLLDRKEAARSTFEDVWTMHKLPDDE